MVRVKVPVSSPLTAYVQTSPIRSTRAGAGGVSVGPVRVVVVTAGTVVVVVVAAVVVVVRGAVVVVGAARGVRVVVVTGATVVVVGAVVVVVTGINVVVTGMMVVVVGVAVVVVVGATVVVVVVDVVVVGSVTPAPDGAAAVGAGVTLPSPPPHALRAEATIIDSNLRFILHLSMLYFRSIQNTASYILINHVFYLCLTHESLSLRARDRIR